MYTFAGYASVCHSRGVSLVEVFAHATCVFVCRGDCETHICVCVSNDDWRCSVCDLSCSCVYCDFEFSKFVFSRSKLGVTCNFLIPVYFGGMKAHCYNRHPIFLLPFWYIFEVVWWVLARLMCCGSHFYPCVVIVCEY